jgi:type I restriction enzyme S subunit
MEEWKNCYIGDVCSTISETYKANSSEVVLVNTSDVLEGKCLNHIKVDNKDLKGQFKKAFHQNDILYSEIRPANKRFAFIDFEPTDYIASTKLMVIRNNESILPEYLFYILQSKTVIEELQMLAESRSGTFPQITFSEVSRMQIKLPNTEEQIKILGVLKSLDKKIELNRRINDNLEQQAQALYKSWFIDFEPFKDGKFVDSEIGMIPEGWKVGTFSDIILSTIGGDWGKDSLLGNYSKEVFCIRGADIPEIRKGNKGKMPTRFILEKNYLSKALEPDNIVVEISGGSPTQSTGRICIISDELKQKYNNSLICTNFCRAIKPYNGYASYIYYLWDMLYNKGVMFLYENGTTGIKNFDINGFIEKEQIIIPTKEVTERFAHTIELLSKQIQQKGTETESLVNIRDSLLPKLMSGELKIKDLNN